MTGNIAGEQSPAASLNKALPALLLLASVFLLNFISRIIFSPLLPEIEMDMALDHAVVGSFFLFISFGYFISILLSGLVSSRLGHKWTIVFSAVGSGVMLTVIGSCTGLIAMRIGLFCLGYVAGLYLQSGLATISRLVSSAYLARGMAVHELAPNIAFVVAPLLCGFMLKYYSWREGLQILGLTLGCMGLIYAVIGEGNGIRQKRLAFAQVGRLVKLPLFGLMILLFSLAICSTLGIYSMLPLYLVSEQGMDHGSANRLLALSRVSSIFMPLVAGWLGDRFGNGLVMSVVLMVAGALTIPFGIFSGYLLVVFVVLQPMIAVCFFPSGFAVLSGIGGSAVQGGAVSLCIPIAFLIGGGVIPMAIGTVGDYYSLKVGFIGIGCITCLTASIVFWLGQKNGFLSRRLSGE